MDNAKYIPYTYGNIYSIESVGTEEKTEKTRNGSTDGYIRWNIGATLEKTLGGDYLFIQSIPF